MTEQQVNKPEYWNKDDIFHPDNSWGEYETEMRATSGIESLKDFIRWIYSLFLSLRGRQQKDNHVSYISWPPIHNNTVWEDDYNDR